MLKKIDTWLDVQRFVREAAELVEEREEQEEERTEESVEKV